MNKKDIAENLRTEVGALEDLIKKLKSRSDRLKKMLFELEEELAGPEARKEIKMLGTNSKFRKVIDRVFGEAPKPPKRP
jgi:predicted nuclease with TOPRIM domain